MLRRTLNLSLLPAAARTAAFAMATTLLVSSGAAQNTPLISGGTGFLTTTDGGKTTYNPIVEPLIAAPLGEHVLIESRAGIVEILTPRSDGTYNHIFNAGLTYVQGDFIVSPHLTVVAGSYLVPFNTYNERLSPVWISNFQDFPLIFSLGTMSTATGVGGMLRGSAISRRKYSFDYTAYVSSLSKVKEFKSQRFFGGNTNLYLPESHLEVGLSYNRQLQDSDENFYGAHVWWEPPKTAFRLRSEFARGHHAQGYWIEADYRTQAFGGLDSWIGRIEPVFRMQQTFRRDKLISDGLPLVNTQRADFGLNYNLPHNTRILTSYARQFASTGNKNVWETSLTYRFLFPAWKGKM